MQIKILSTLWGYQHLGLEACLDKINAAGFDGLDTFIPEDERQRDFLLNYLEKHGLSLVVQQHLAHGDSFEAFKQSFRHHLETAAAARPLLINSHTGRDYYSFAQNLELVDLARSLSEKTGIAIVHETHRGRFGYSPAVMNEYFKARPELAITADLSHWVCVTESFLEGFSEILEEAVRRTRHVHARVGYQEGPQITDPRAPEWQDAVHIFLKWWDRIVEERRRAGAELLTITAEFGPPPYMPTIPFAHEPVADLFEVNSYIKDLLKSRYAL